MRELRYSGLKYNGQALLEGNDLLKPYFPEADLIQAVEISRLLRRPLLLRGEPGCGKTRLAEAVAFELYGYDYKDYYFKWSIKSTSKILDGLYRFDHLRRLQDIQDKNIKRKPPKETYLTLGPLGNAFQKATKSNPTILLIDEIDKADLDFPNDLLNLLDSEQIKEIEVPEADYKIIGRYPPIVIITSNDERELPPAFLRRCTFHYIEFPDKQQLDKITLAYMKSFQENNLEEDEISRLVEVFLNLRERMRGTASVDKLPSTSELLDWIFTHAYYRLEEKELGFVPGSLGYSGVLLKTENDLRSQLGNNGN